MTTPRLFYAPGTCALAAHVALEEAGATFETVKLDMAQGEHRRPDFLRINPKARVPALQIGDWVLTENPAILQYVALAHPQAELWPRDLRDQARALEWMAWLSSTVHVAFAHLRRAERYAASSAAVEDVRAKGLESSHELWAAIEARLGAGPWVLGAQFTVVDAYLVVFANWSRMLEIDFERDCPKWAGHARRMRQRPAVRRAFEREGLSLPD